MKAVIAVPPVFDFYFTPHRFSVLGAEILSDLLSNAGISAKLMNFPLLQKRPARQNLPEAMAYLKPYLIEHETGKISFFSQYKRLGPSIPDCAGQICRDNPDLVLISCFAFCYADAALDLAENVRKINPRICIVLGGAGVSAYPEYFIRCPAVDFALTGEAEVSVKKFLNIFKSQSKNFGQVPNLYYKVNGQIVLPSAIKRTAANEVSFTLKKMRESEDKVWFTTALSRGCPKQCRFCSNFLSFGRDFRTVPVDVVKSEIDDVNLSSDQNRKTAYVNFEDDNLLCDPEYFLSIIDILKSKFAKVFFLAENGIDYTILTPELLKTLIKSGMKQFNISLASINQVLLDSQDRKISLRLYEETIKVLQEHRIPSITYFICGLKNDSKDHVVSNIIYLAGQETRLGISLFYPVPGLAGFQERTLFEAFPSFLCAGSSAYPWNQSLTTAEMVTAFRLSRFVNLLKSQSRSVSDDMLIDKIMQERMLYTMIKSSREVEIIPVPNLDQDMVDLFFQRLSHVEKLCC